VLFRSKALISRPSSYIFKALASCKFLNSPYRIFAYRLLMQISVDEQQNACFETLRSRAYVSDYGVSRLIFKKYVMSGSYTGLKKFVW